MARMNLILKEREIYIVSSLFRDFRSTLGFSSNYFLDLQRYPSEVYAQRRSHLCNHTLLCSVPLSGPFRISDFIPT